MKEENIDLMVLMTFLGKAYIDNIYTGKLHNKLAPNTIYPYGDEFATPTINPSSDFVGQFREVRENGSTLKRGILRYSNGASLLARFN